MSIGPIIVFWLCIALVCGLIGATVCGALAPGRGRSVLAWVVIGFLCGASFGPIGFTLAAVVLLVGPDLRRKSRCPRCGQYPPDRLPACSRCGLPFAPPRA